MMKDDTQLYREFVDNEGFRRSLTDTVYELACEQANPLIFSGEKRGETGNG